MTIAEWDERYRARREDPAREAPPADLVAETAARLAPGRALDLACGAGRNAIWLAAKGWKVTAVDGSQAAVDILRRRASAHSLVLSTAVADLEADEFPIEAAKWDLIVSAYYLQRGLFERIRAGVRPGGVAIVIAHTVACGEEPSAHRLRPGELRAYFSGWALLHDYEGVPRDAEHQRAVAEIAARRPEN